MMDEELPTTPVPLNNLEIGYLMMVGIRGSSLRKRCAEPEADPTARGIYLKLKAAAIALGVEWHYGDPWEIE